MHALFPQPMHAYTYTGIASIKKTPKHAIVYYQKYNLMYIYIRILGYLNTHVSIYQMAILMDWRINLEKH